ncbi:MAG: shikimate dehydrogenase, partial [Pseudomonadota bacterium]
GAANTLIFGEGREILADNTDGFGFFENIEESGIRINKTRPAVVIGAGGASLAIVNVLESKGFPSVRIANRTRSRIDAIADRYPGFVEPYDLNDAESALPGAGLIINTTSLGMNGQRPLSLDLSHAEDDAVATDIVYTPLITPFLERASARGLATIDGLGMLLHQGRPGFKAWFGVMPEVDEELRSLMLAP